MLERTITQHFGDERLLEKMSKKTLLLIALLIAAAGIPTLIQWALDQWRQVKKGQRAIIALEALLNESATEFING